jgi:hypothetical protein
VPGAGCASGASCATCPATEAAWLAGKLNDAHVGPLAAARTPATAECFARDEEMLVGHARGCATAAS